MTPPKHVGESYRCSAIRINTSKSQGACWVYVEVTNTLTTQTALSMTLRGKH